MAAPVSRAAFEEVWSLLALGHRQGFALGTGLLQSHRDPFSVALLSGLLFQAEGKSREAYAAYSQAAAAAPDDPRSYLGIAQSLLQLGHPDKALAAGAKALELDAGFWQAALVIADALYAAGSVAEAIAHYHGILATGAASPVVHLGLGTALLRAGRLAEAQGAFVQAIAMDPNCVAGYCNLGNTLMAMGRYDEASTLYRQALALPEVSVGAVLHANLAKAGFVTGDYAGAEAESRRALALDPDLPEAHGYLAEALWKLGRQAEALPHYRKHGTPDSAAKALEGLYHLGDMEAFAAAQKALARSQPDNIRLAAISAQAAARHGSRFASQFCAAPLGYIAIQNLAAALAPFESFAQQVMDEARALDTVWEPPAKTTKGGYQSEGNIFALTTPAIARLEAVLRESIAAYFAARAGAGDRYVSHRPKALNLTGWVVRLRRQGRQDLHIHPDGWLSGVLYLRLAPGPPPQGAIGFALGGSAASDFQHQPREGDLVLFPSSLFHHTVPFSADAERVSLAFDLLPRRR